MSKAELVSDALDPSEVDQAPLAQLYKALSQAQGEFLPIEKNRSVTIQPREGRVYSFRYADLDEVIAKTRPALAKHGLALYQLLEPGRVTCVLAHASGQTVSSWLELPDTTRMDPKQLGGLISYYRRYLVVGLLGVAASDDLDEEGNIEGGQKDAPPAAKPARPTPAPPAPPEQPGEALITEAKARRLFQLAGRRHLDIVKDVLREHGYERSEHVRARDYPAILDKLSVRIAELSSDAAAREALGQAPEGSQ